MKNETFDRNIDINDLLEIWQWCSRRLHVKWQRKRRLRNGCFIGITVALSDETDIIKALQTKFSNIYAPKSTTALYSTSSCLQHTLLGANGD